MREYNNYKLFKYILFSLLLKIIYCINISNLDIEAISYVVDFQQCIQNCKLNQINNKNCKLNCYIDFGSLGYKNNFSFGVAPDKLLFDINNQVKAFKINNYNNLNNGKYF